MHWTNTDMILALAMGFGFGVLLFLDDDKKEASEEEKRETSSVSVEEKAGVTKEEEKSDPFIPYNKRKPEYWECLVPYTVLANAVLKYCAPILRAEGIIYMPGLVIKYYKHKKFLGVYQGGLDNIIVYLKGHENIPAITDTILHEIRHSIQNKRMKKEYNRYDRYTQEVGYYDNPLEIDARKFAAEQLEGCMKYLEENGFIRYKSEKHGYIGRASARCFNYIFGRNIRNYPVQKVDKGRYRKKRAA